MKILIGITILVLCFTLGAGTGLLAGAHSWAGIDEAVVEVFAVKAGRPSKPPLIPTDQGDLPLFVFTMAGCLGGFLVGYYFKQLFGQSQRQSG